MMIGSLASKPVRIIQIAAAVIDDHEGRLLLVRKAGYESFMQAGGKIEPGEDAKTALRRELLEEIGLLPNEYIPRYIGYFSAPAANEPGFLVGAYLYHIRIEHEPCVSAEIEEALWVSPKDALKLTLAPLTRDFVLPMVPDLT